MMDAKIELLESEINSLKELLIKKENDLIKLKSGQNAQGKYSEFFTKNEIARYCRQIILPQLSVKGQLSLKNAKIAIVGAGGLGCPAAQYLTAAGIGTVGLIDKDVVSISNLHRQILYSENDLNELKVNVACNKLSKLNSHIKLIPLSLKLTQDNAVKILKEYDIILDCTDNVPTRYLVNDVCMLLDKPLVAGNAIKLQGQLSVHIPKKTPCYRCLYQHPPSLECVGSCNEDGVIGAVPGIIGVLQALEAIKLIINQNSDSNHLTLFEGETGKFRHMNLRPPRLNCDVCSENATITLESLPNYEEWCGMISEEAPNRYPPKVIMNEEKRINVNTLFEQQKNNVPFILVDVRSETEYQMCRLPFSVNYPIMKLMKKQGKEEFITEIKQVVGDEKQLSKLPIYSLCRCGNDSQLAVPLLENIISEFNPKVYDIAGGLYAWNEFIDSSFPLY